MKSFNNGEWKINQAEFKGFVKAKLEDLEKNLNANHVELREDIGEIQRNLTGLKVKTAGIAAIISIILAISMKFIL